MRRVFLLGLIMFSASLAGCAGESGSGLADSDGDGLPDSAEQQGWTVSIVSKEGSSVRNVTSDPKVRDTDGDGLEDLHERASPQASDARDVDTDGDGLLDGPDLVVDPESARAIEWRARGILEQPRGTFLGEMKRCSDGARGLNPVSWSSDLPFADNLGDGEELAGWTITLRGVARHVVSDPCHPDGDGDTLQDHDEKRLGTDPNESDTDGDGARDGVDADPLWDLGLGLGNVTLSTREGVVLRLFVGTTSVEAGSGELLSDVGDASADRAHLVAHAIVDAVDERTGEIVRLFPGERGVVLEFDLLAGRVTLDGEELPEGALTFEGADGSVTFDWFTTRS